MTTELKVLVGIPASGKSTWAEREALLLEEEHKTCAIISRDKIRKNLLSGKDRYFDKEKAVFKEFVRQINEALELGFHTVIADATHVSEASRNKLLTKLVFDKGTKLTYEVFDVPVEVALQRNAFRTGFEKVPDSAIKRMKRSFSYPEIDNDMGFKEVEMVIHGREKEKK